MEQEQEEFDYEADLQIDPDALDVEWLEQPNLLMRYSARLAEEAQRLSFYKERRDIMASKWTLAVRNNAKAYDLPDKATEAMYAAVVNQQPEVRALRKKVIEQTKLVDLLAAATRAIDQRKNALENLVRLSGQNYFAGPRTPRELGLEYQKKKKETAANKKAKLALGRKND